ncbi:MAG: hypothetical protein KFH98_13700 [Gemmatimonadetes bacterium]|nr:hypothetical protein [Gemmatimonadota bacterium]
MLKLIVNDSALATCHVRNVDAYGRRLMEWLHRFRGVASKYRDNYLAWHRRINDDYDLMWARGMIGAGIRMPGTVADDDRELARPAI